MKQKQRAQGGYGPESVVLCRGAAELRLIALKLPEKRDGVAEFRVRDHDTEAAKGGLVEPVHGPDRVVEDLRAKARRPERATGDLGLYESGQSGDDG